MCVYILQSFNLCICMYVGMCVRLCTCIHVRLCIYTHTSHVHAMDVHKYFAEITHVGRLRKISPHHKRINATHARTHKYIHTYHPQLLWLPSSQLLRDRHFLFSIFRLYTCTHTNIYTHVHTNTYIYTHTCLHTILSSSASASSLTTQFAVVAFSFQSLSSCVYVGR